MFSSTSASKNIYHILFCSYFFPCIIQFLIGWFCCIVILTEVFLHSFAQLKFYIIYIIISYSINCILFGVQYNLKATSFSSTFWHNRSFCFFPNNFFLFYLFCYFFLKSIANIWCQKVYRNIISIKKTWENASDEQLNLQNCILFNRKKERKEQK